MCAETTNPRDIFQPGQFAVNCNGVRPLPETADPPSDNYPLSGSGVALLDGRSPIDPLVAKYCQASHAPSTARAYAADLHEFERWGGQLPATSDQVARYLAQSAPSLRPSTLHRRLAALASAHHDAGHPDPTKARVVRQVMQGIERLHGCHPNQVSPLLLDDLACIVATMGSSLRDLRDCALLLVGFFGALRRSEVVALNLDDVRFRQEGLDLAIRKSKTDQQRVGRTVHLTRSTTDLDPASALERWIARSGISAGAIFRDARLQARLSDRSVARIVKKWVAEIGRPPEKFSGHSLRAGFATSAALTGLDGTLIARQTGHASLQTVATYVRPPNGICSNGDLHRERGLGPGGLERQKRNRPSMPVSFAGDARPLSGPMVRTGRRQFVDFNELARYDDI